MFLFILIVSKYALGWRKNQHPYTYIYNCVTHLFIYINKFKFDLYIKNCFGKSIWSYAFLITQVHANFYI